MTQNVHRGGKIWVRIFPDKSVTVKPTETRMDSGKEYPEYWVTVIKPSIILYELSEVTENIARKAISIAVGSRELMCIRVIGASNRRINGINDTSSKKYIEGLVLGGLFRVSSMDNGDGIAVRWLGHPIFRDKDGCELFLVLIDSATITLTNITTCIETFRGTMSNKITTTMEFMTDIEKCTTLTSVPRYTWWIDSGATTHINMSMQGCQNYRKSNDGERYIYVDNTNLIELKQ
ncbi:hypothetical protein Gotri_006105 [Gossypium trilobum]|uniref:Ribosomal protein L10e/L16 domain-containing protein n=1 Tax=Gossypium trilobum TaxID=34281 RepID=A0A7J9EZ84_9ROSI|nr:hypothetical protein [Gossypium trilobum]